MRDRERSEESQDGQGSEKSQPNGNIMKEIWGRLGEVTGEVREGLGQDQEFN